MKGRFWRKALAAALALLIVSGSAPIKPITDVFGDIAITVSAESNTIDIEASGQTISDATTWENCTVNITGSNKVNFYERITISGDVTLNLGAGATLNAPYGITVNEGNSLTIAGDGSLTAGAYGGDYHSAAIGGTQKQNSGTINITGGTINATSYDGGAGIGGGENGSATIINISGGNVTATGSSWSAGIGGGYNGSAGTITITGGVVNATGTYCGAGIGGGGGSTNPGSGGTITISGGQVTATGGKDNNTPFGYGIGPGKSSNTTTDGTLGTLSLSWTENTDFINASSYKGTISFEDGKRFYYDGTTDYVTADELANKLSQKIVPAVANNNSLAFADIQMPRYYITTNGTAVDVSYDVYDYNGNKLTLGTHYTALIKNSSNEEVSTFDQLGDYTLTVTGTGTTYTGSKSFTFSLVEWDANLSVDGSDHYINFPSDGTKKTVYLGAGQTIKVYDSEGKNGNLVPSDGRLMLYAPEGYALEVTGKTDAQFYTSGEYRTWLKAYDGNDETETELITTIDQNNDNISFASAADGMLMRFYVYDGQSAKEKYGLDLTVRVVEATPHNITVGTADNGSIASDKATANTNESVTLTVNPADGYLLKRIIVTDTDNGTTLSTIGEDHWYSGGNTVTYKMPNKNIKFTPEFANVLSADDGLTLNIDPIRTTEYVIPEGVQSFNIKGSADNSSTVTAILKAPEGVHLLATIYNCKIYNSYSYISVYDGTGSSSTLIKQLTTNDASISLQTSTAEYMTFEIHGLANTRLNGKIEMVYSINYDLAGGSVATENPATYTYDTNAFTLTNPTREGYEFAGWTGTGLDTASTSVIIAKGSYGNRSYTATWKKLLTNSDITIEAIADQTYTGNSITPDVTVKDVESTLTLGTDYTIEYSDNTNAGTAKATITGKGNYSGTVEKTFAINKATPTVTAPTANTLTYNGGEQELVTAGSTDFGKVLYSLDGTNYSEKVPKGTNAGKYTVYYKVDTDNYYYASQMVEVTIAESYTITWKNGDEIVETDNYVPGGATPVYNGNAPTKGTTAQYTYTFSGWRDGTNTYAPNALPAVSGDVTYTAQFDSEVNKYTVTWKNGSTILETDTEVPYGTTPTYNGEAPTKTSDAMYSYSFAGWSPSVSPVKGDVTYTAQFNSVARNYTITYKVDGEVYTTKTVSYGNSITLPDAPTREGYTFSGWQTSYTTMPAQNIEITGTFAIDQYAVTYMVDGVQYGESLTVDHGTKLTAPEAPTKNGAIFLGWTVDGVNAYDFETPVTAETTLTAMWLDASGFITFSEGYAVTDNTYNGTDRDYVGFRFDVNMDNSNYTVLQHGILYGMNVGAFGNGQADANLRFTDDSASALMDKVREFAAQNTDTETTDWIEVYIGDRRDGVVYARGFIIVTDGTKKYLIYSDVQQGSYNSFSE